MSKICNLSEFAIIQTYKAEETPALYYLFMLLSSLCNLLYEALSPQ